MAFNFDVITEVDQKTKDIVLGFIKKSNQLLVNNSNFIIPEIIHFVCLLYYYQSEYFTQHGDAINIGHTNDIAKFSDNTIYESSSNTVYGKVIIDKATKYNKYIWKFKITDPSERVIIGFGIDSSDKEFSDTAFYSHNSNPYYAYYTGDGDGARFSDVQHVYGDYGKEYIKHNDEIKMELTIGNTSLRYYVNDEDLGVAFDDVKFENNERYAMAVCIDEKVTIELIDFQQIMS
eukprot:348354_1